MSKDAARRHWAIENSLHGSVDVAEKLTLQAG